MKGIIYFGAIAVIFAFALGDVFATKPGDEFQSNRLVLAGDAAPIDEKIMDTDIKRSGMNEMNKFLSMSMMRTEMEACKDLSSTKICKKLKKKGKCDSEAAKKNCKKTCDHCDDEEEEQEECCCEAALYKYSYPGVVPLGKGDVVWTTNYWARQFKVEFDIQVTKELSDNYHNVFHMTIGEDGAQYGDRIPGVWVNKGKYFLIDSAVSGKLNHGKFINYQLNQTYHIEIKQEENSNGEIIYRIVVDGTTVHEVVNNLPQRFEKVILYTSNPWSPSFASFGELKNLNIVNLDKFPA